MDSQAFVDWFRNSAPYINAHRGRTFVIQFSGDAVADTGLFHDIALLNSLGVRLVLVHGIRAQIERRLSALGLSSRYVDGLRVTDEQAMEAVKDAAGSVLVTVEAMLSMGLPNSPMAGTRIRTASGNFVTARPIGVRDGVDFCHTGEVRRIDTASMNGLLDSGAIVVLPPLGYSPTGEVFNLSAEEVATCAAIELRAAKLLLLSEGTGLADGAGAPLRQLTLAEAKARLARHRQADQGPADESLHQLASAVRACRNGVARAHLIARPTTGALLLELFTRDGIGTLVSAEPYEQSRRATIDDVGGILEIINPLERDGVLVRRSREKLETEIERFMVMERDGSIIGCAAAYPFPKERFAELACLAVHPDYRQQARAGTLLDAVEMQARAAGAGTLFVLTTRATHWFMEHGFEAADLADLPVARQALYNYRRNSKVLVKPL